MDELAELRAQLDRAEATIAQINIDRNQLRGDVSGLRITLAIMHERFAGAKLMLEAATLMAEALEAEERYQIDSSLFWNSQDAPVRFNTEGERALRQQKRRVEIKKTQALAAWKVVRDD